MAEFDNRYSRRIAWLKILLPMAALAILSSLFLVSKPKTPSITQLPPDQIVGDNTYKPHITGPSLSGVTRNGSTYTFSAGLAAPGTDDTITMSDFAGTLTSNTGFNVDVSASLGVIQNQNSIAVLSQGVRLTTSDGYDITTEELTADISNTVISSHGAISGTSPFGTVDAGQMILRQQSQDGSKDTYELLFKKGVKVVYQPGN